MHFSQFSNSSQEWTCKEEETKEVEKSMGREVKEIEKTFQQRRVAEDIRRKEEVEYLVERVKEEMRHKRIHQRTLDHKHFYGLLKDAELIEKQVKGIPLSISLSLSLSLLFLYL